MVKKQAWFLLKCCSHGPCEWDFHLPSQPFPTGVFLVMHGNEAGLVELPHALGSQHRSETQHLFAVNPTQATAEMETVT